MSLEKLEHLRALADYLGKEVYAFDYEEPSGEFRLLPGGPGQGTEPLARFRVYKADEATATAEQGTVVRWPFRGAEFLISRIG